MSLAVRIIPRIDIKGPNLVKGVYLEGLRVLGKPEEFAKYYYENGADELIYQDVVASLYERNSLHDIISKTAKEVFIPLTVGGGIRNIEDISNILRAGADKVSINTAAIENPSFIKKASRKFGASTIVIAIEAIRQPDGTYMAFTDNGRNYTGKEAVSWAKEVESLGAGEILLTSVDQEGSGDGLNIDLISQISDSISIPVVAHGGTGKLSHVSDLFAKVPVSGVAIASLFHYDYISMNRNTDGYEKEGNIDFLKSNRILSTIQPSTINGLKKYLKDKNISCRVNE
ncbi:MAG: imidazole glycerol phosphate synthase cyclase subunit [Proteobacteria bacterium]|nr:imidazole glycerol phosphate synthase cyclase subunit [Pseudomonadota bacterium]MBU1389493.1 imidazole glycerol phosphate synthase cyclase subunit [Pseudomonadota bacterium]MBU1541313.1 imidazole glycerol phosphate synthase cyclase subunit [Pseudomonadota bacterium]MBU2481727.1 imidazole glycerol phosphate synthase cyclase subunit [Pseudomonadota bacterium]